MLADQKFLQYSRAGLKGRRPLAILTGGTLWRNSWRHRS